MSLGFLAPLAMAALTLLTSISGGSYDPSARAPVRFVDVRGAASMVARGAVVLDARDAVAYALGHLPGAQTYAWQRVAGNPGASGRNMPPAQALADAFAAMGIDGSRPTLIYGAGEAGWGEEGHAAWILAMLGHADVAVLDGGFRAWRAAGRPVVTATTPPRPTRWTPRARGDLRATREDVERSAQIVDVRTTVEFSGATPFGEPRGGHIPSARHLDWRTLLDESGRLLPASRIQRLLDDAGIDSQREIVTYCTSGVRSAFVTVALLARGVARVRNYDGSMIEWASDPDSRVVR